MSISPCIHVYIYMYMFICMRTLSSIVYAFPFHVLCHGACACEFMQVIEAIRASNNDEFFEAMEGGKAICL